LCALKVTWFSSNFDLVLTDCSSRARWLDLRIAAQEDSNL
jgi:hypothetical protein